MSLALATKRQEKDSNKLTAAETAKLFAKTLQDRYVKLDENVIALVAGNWKDHYGPRKSELFDIRDYQLAVAEVEAHAEVLAKQAVNVLGAEDAEVLKQVMLDVLENYDGSGPKGKKADQIRPEAFVLKFARTVQNIIENVPNRYRTHGTDSVFENVIALQEHYPPGMISRLIPVIEKLLTQKEHGAETMRMAELGRMTAAILHDIDNYLTAISGYFELATEHALSLNKQEANENRQKAFLAIEGMKSFTGGMLEFARGTKKPVKGHVNKTIDDALVLAQHNLHHVNVVKSYGTLPNIDLFPAELAHVFHNILKNAAQVVGSDGEISIKSRVEGKNIVVSISDNGPGMTEDELANALSGNSTKHDGKAIGLEFCKYVVERHNGSLSFESEKGKGTTVNVVLPLDDEALSSLKSQDEKLSYENAYFVSKVFVTASDASQVKELIRSAINTSEPDRITEKGNALHDNVSNITYAITDESMVWQNDLMDLDRDPLWLVTISQHVGEAFRTTLNPDKYAKKMSELAKDRVLETVLVSKELQMEQKDEKGRFMPLK